MCLYTLDDSLQSLTNNRNTIQTFGLPTPSQPRPEQVDPLQSAILYEQSYDTNEQERIWTNSYALFNPDQKYVFDTINAAVENHTGECFFVDALAGTGKTFVINALLAKWRQNNLIAPAVATSAIAAILLAGGKTAHSRFNFLASPCNFSPLLHQMLQVGQQQGKCFWQLMSLFGMRQQWPAKMQQNWWIAL